jgi:hypothetical protein
MALFTNGGSSSNTLCIPSVIVVLFNQARRYLLSQSENGGAATDSTYEGGDDNGAEDADQGLVLWLANGPHGEPIRQFLVAFLARVRVERVEIVVRLMTSSFR